MNKINQMLNQHFPKYTKNIYDHHFIQNSQPNNFNQRQRQKRPNSSKNQNQMRNMVKNNKNFSNFNIYASPAKKRNNRYYSQNPQNSNRKNNKYNEGFFDMRINYCLKMLGLDYLQIIFEKNNITFDDLLILSLKDLANLGIPKNKQIIIKNFSIDYIKNASYYSWDELENYFRNIYNNYIYNNSRINHSQGNLNINKAFIINNNNYNNERYNYSNITNSNNNLMNNRNNRYEFNNLKNKQEYPKRGRSPTINNNKKSSLIKKNINMRNYNNNYNSISYDFIYNNKKKNINTNLNNYNTSNSNINEGYCSSSNFNQSSLTNYGMKKNKNNIREEILQSQNKIKRFDSEENKKIRQLNDFSKKQINILTNDRLFVSSNR